MQKHLLTLYTRTPLHVGCGTSVDVVDLPITRERITNFPIIPSSGLKGVFLQSGRGVWPSTWVKKNDKDKEVLHPTNQLLFGSIVDEAQADGTEKQVSNAGCVQIIEAKLLAFPVRSLKGCFAWLTCPSALHRFQRDTGEQLTIPPVSPGQAITGTEITDGTHVFLEEYTLESAEGDLTAILGALKPLCVDTLWQEKHATRLALISDEDFQHFVTTCTEVVQRVAIDPSTRVVKKGGLFSQENVPCETLFYSVLTLLPTRQAQAADLSSDLTALLNASPVLQIGGDETTGHGFCSVWHEPLPLAKRPNIS